jgi:hypothetical protein
MPILFKAGDEVFLDSSYAIALATPKDRFHAEASRLATEMEHARTRLVTTRAVLLEIGNALAKQRYRDAAIRLFEAIHSDPVIEVRPLSEELYQRSFELYRSRADKEWGLVDCVSFIVMRDRGLYNALTADEHFRQAGFRPLLRESSDED